MFFGAADTLSIDSTESKGSSAPTALRKRVIWLQNSADHYFVQMLDKLNLPMLAGTRVGVGRRRYGASAARGAVITVRIFPSTNWVASKKP